MTPRDAPSVPELLAAGRSFSFEFMPPRTDAGEAALWGAVRELEALAPSFVSVTYGAGGSRQDRTVRVTARIAEETTLTPVGHLTCVGADVAALRRVVGAYAAAGVRTVLALRGDPPEGPRGEWTPPPGGLRYASELVALVRSLGDFAVGVAAFPEGHPHSVSLEQDARVLAAKQDAGASFAVTQFFFRSQDYFALRDRAARHGVTMPIVPGLMPITHVGQVRRFAELSGADLPGELVERLEAVADDPEAVRQIGVEVASDLGAQLLAGGAPGLHFYTLNRSTATREVYAALGLPTALAS